MQFRGVYHADSQIVRLTVEQVAADPDAPRADVVVQHVPASIGEPGFSVCLRCDAAFESGGPGNRICPTCTLVNNGLLAVTPEDRHRGCQARMALPVGMKEFTFMRRPSFAIGRRRAGWSLA